MEIAASKHVMAHHITSQWDLIIAHPPCTYITNAGARWLYAGGKLNEERYQKGVAGKNFFMKFLNANCERIAVENPIPSRIYELPPYTQIIQPYQFGEPWSKKTCLWLKGLPQLKPTNIVSNYKPYCSSGSYSGTHDPKFKGASRKGGAAKSRSKTFFGIAKAMAEQWNIQNERKEKRTLNLYELTNDFLQLQAMLEDPEIDSQVIVDTMEAIEMELEDKADGYAKVIRNMEGSVAAIRTEQERLANKKNLLEAGIKRLKENLQASMIATGKRKFKTDLFSFGIQKNGGADPVIVDVDTADLPDDLVIITEAPDKKAIGELLKKDPEQGAKYAHFGERGESLRIK